MFFVWLALLPLYVIWLAGLLGRLYYDGKSFWKHSVLLAFYILERMVSPKVRSNFGSPTESSSKDKETKNHAQCRMSLEFLTSGRPKGQA
jgi:hypothetical protein